MGSFGVIFQILNLFFRNDRCTRVDFLLKIHMQTKLFIVLVCWKVHLGHVSSSGVIFPILRLFIVFLSFAKFIRGISVLMVAEYCDKYASDMRVFTHAMVICSVGSAGSRNVVAAWAFSGIKK